MEIFDRITETSRNKGPIGLERMRRLMELLGNPERSLRIFHVGGTNGKGSCSYYIKAILESAGYRVGMFTSPHVMVYNERFQIGEEMITDADFERLADKVMSFNDNLASEGYGYPSVFEILTAVAYLYFAERKPDYVIMEVGIGGRYDATNTIEKPLACLITQIGLDHTAMLGHTLLEIAGEKACIIKKGVPIVSESSEDEVRFFLRGKAEEMESKFIDSSRNEYTIKDFALKDGDEMLTRFSATIADCRYEDLTIGMIGEHQVRNAIASVSLLKEVMEIPDEAIREGLRIARNPGRFEIMQSNPYIIIDGAHNPSGIDAVVSTFRQAFPSAKDEKILLAFGCLSDKECDTMIEQISSEFADCRLVAVQVESERTFDCEKLRDRFADKGCSCIACHSTEALLELCESGDYELILILGSIYLIGSIRALMLNK